MKTEFDIAAGFRTEDQAVTMWDHVPHLKVTDVAESLIYLLSTSLSVTVSELTLEPTVVPAKSKI